MSTEWLAPEGGVTSGDAQESSVEETKVAAVLPSVPKSQTAVESGAKLLPSTRSGSGRASSATLGCTSEMAGSLEASKYVRVAWPCSSGSGSILTATSTDPSLPPGARGTVQLTDCPSGRSKPGTQWLPKPQ